MTGYGTTTRAFDSDNRLLSESKGEAVIVSHTYDASRQKGLLSTTDTDGRVISYAYSARNELASASKAAGTESYAYDYGQTQSPALNRSQLTAETSTRAGATFSYGYDGSTTGGPGNPTSFKGSTNTFNADNQVTNTGNAYDGNGSPTTYKSTALTFDPEQRLTAYGSAETNGYDGDGLRAWVSGGGSKNYFVYDGDQRLLALKSDGSVQYYLTFGANGLLGS